MTNNTLEPMLPSQKWHHEPSGCYVSDDINDIDINALYDFLHNHAYWAKGIPLDIVKRSAEQSHCFGLFTKEGQQIGFCRVVTDHATSAYVGDVYVLENHRGQGLASFLMNCMMTHPNLQGLRRWILLTADMQDLYKKFGFEAPTQQEWYMDHCPKDRVY